MEDGGWRLYYEWVPWEIFIFNRSPLTYATARKILFIMKRRGVGGIVFVISYIEMKKY